MIFFFSVAVKQIKNPKNLVQLVESWSKESWNKEMRSLLYVQFSLPRWSIFLEVPNPKLRIIIIILPTDRLTDRPEIILPTARTTKN